jgi:hypothetical protein
MKVNSRTSIQRCEGVTAIDRVRYAAGEEASTVAPTLDKATKKMSSVLPPEQAVALFDGEARRLAGMSGDEFLKNWDAGEFRDLDETPEGRKIAYLALLIPFGRPDSCC